MTDETITNPQIERMKPITKDEWNRFDWIDITSFGDSQDVALFLRGVEKEEPPDDGYVYIEKTSFGDVKQRWVRAMKMVDE